MSLDSDEGDKHVWQLDRKKRGRKRGESRKGGVVFILRGTEHASCAKCAQVKPLTEFSPDSARSTGHASYCHQCKRENNRHNRRSKKREEIR